MDKAVAGTESPRGGGANLVQILDDWVLDALWVTMEEADTKDSEEQVQHGDERVADPSTGTGLG